MSIRGWFGRARRGLPFQPAPEAEVDGELAFHLEQRIRDYLARGMDPAAARAAALQRFGDLPAVRRECARLLGADRRVQARRDWLGDLRQDLGFGIRTAVRAPLFTLLAVVTLALGIGANTAVFSAVKAVLLDALPYREAGQLVRLYGRMIVVGDDRGPLSAGTVHDLRERQRSFASLAAFADLPNDAVYTGGDAPRVITLSWVEPALFATLGVPAALGRVIRDDDAPGDTARALMLSHTAWQRIFGGDPRVIGRIMYVNGIARTVAGVLPRGFIGPAGDVDVYFPLNLASTLRDPIQARSRRWLGAVGRLRPGASVAGARREMDALAADLERQYPRENGKTGITTLSLRDAMAGDMRTPLVILMASAALVLLIMCANLAGALLSRTIVRRKELAVRMALGAGRGRIVRQLLAESALLAVAGGIAGVLLAIIGLHLMSALAASVLPPYAQLSLDAGALIFALLIALCAGLTFGMAPALAVGRWNAQATLREETRGSSESRRARVLRGALVSGQIALSVSLLAGAGLLARSLWTMANRPLGFTPDGVLTVPVRLPLSSYGTAASRIQFYQELEARLRALPGVRAVANTSVLPTRMTDRSGFSIQGVTWPTQATPFVLYASVSDDFFRTMGIPILQGRTFDASDRADGPPRVVISASMARRWWPRGNALGAHIHMGPDPNAPWDEVIGIVGDIRNDPAALQPEPVAYDVIRANPWDNQIFLIRTAGAPARGALVKSVQRQLSALDPRLPLTGAETLSDVLGDALAGRRLPVVLMSAFGMLALLLVSVGIYAMFATMAAAREREFGVRVALGSSRGAIAALVLRQGGVWMAAGLAGGALGVLVVSHLVRRLLFGVSPLDPVVLGASVATLLVCATIALLVPVRRATRADPIAVLR